MIYIVPKEEMAAAVERINESRRNMLTSIELELESFRAKYPRVPKSVLKHEKRYGLISAHLDAHPAKTYTEVWTYYEKGTYWKDADVLVTESGWGGISDKKIAENMVLCEI